MGLVVFALVLSVLSYRAFRKKGKSQLVSALIAFACFAFFTVPAIYHQAGM